MNGGFEIRQMPLEGAFTIKPKVFSDKRGSLIKLYTKELLGSQSIVNDFEEQFLSISNKGVLRGLHYQPGKYSQARLITCLQGESFEVIVDLRKKSTTYGKWISTTISEDNRLLLYVPRGLAHGFLSMKDGTELLYCADNKYSPEYETGIVWNDKFLSIKWPEMLEYTISERDKKLPSFEKAEKFE